MVVDVQQKNTSYNLDYYLIRVITDKNSACWYSVGETKQFTMECNPTNVLVKALKQ